ncbi:AMP-binding protein [Mycobacterium sp. 852013-50091_SCH5140682]|uniref:class I adenylate-forming enzyme family protein n=1 Tax=Mycobacterium sp. 852013-50091_SCH5140682 TaxID=1834109 RepID=UPI0007E98541|nr:class I adenylate-forming enzyme family protein [Mycobacterium sp. 852013-50091_SCH5140682]OBC02913.1 AMP-binding protein [Mycobacterium sp. 852013-50091_SCH5140682]
MTISTRALLSPEERCRLAALPELGGGNLLATAMAVHPDPHIPFIRTVRPVINTAGEEQTEFTLAQLDALAQSWSVWYHEQGVGPRDRVALYMADTFAYTIHLNALAQLGAIGVLINSKASPALALGLCERTTPVGMYTDRTRFASIAEAIGSLDGLRWVQFAEDVPAPAPASLPDAWRFNHAPEDPVSIMHSSGTTGIPKAVIQTHASSVAGPRYRLVNYTEPAHERMMTAQPQSHLGCIVYTAYSILAGTPLVALYDPTGEELAAAVRQHQPKGVMAFAHAYSELAALETPSGTVDSVDYWVNMGDAIHEAHIGAILAKRSPNQESPTFYDRFGTTELGWGLVVQPRTLASERSDRRVGKPDPGLEVAVLRPDGSKAPVGEVGFFGAKGPSITAGYWNDADTTYRSKLGGYWLTGDLVYQNADGDYFVVDRTKDAIQTAEGTGYSVLMEEMLLSEIGTISDCAVVAGRHGDQTVPVAVVVTDDSPAAAARLLAEANHILEKAGHPRIAVLDVARTPDDFPVGVTGKVLKRQLRDRYSDLAISLHQENRAIAAFITDQPHGAVA